MVKHNEIKTISTDIKCNQTDIPYIQEEYRIKK